MVTAMIEDVDRRWYYSLPGVGRVGPVRVEVLRELYAQARIDESTLVWTQGLGDWLQIWYLVEQLYLDDVEVTPIVPDPHMQHQPELEHESEFESGFDDVPAAPQEYKPRKGTYLFSRRLGTFIVALLLSGLTVGLLLLVNLPAWYASGVFVAVAVWGAIVSHAAYRKEKYELLDSHIRCRRGGLLSDQTNEMDLSKITHIKLRLPWLRYKFFGVGDVIIESAGNIQPLVFFAVHNPDDIYDELQKRMRKKGFDLTRSELLFEDKPAMIGILLKCLSPILGAVIAVIFAYVALYAGDQSWESEAPIVDDLLQAIPMASLVLAILYGTLRYFDLRRRSYQVYNDAVVYEEGFLTRSNAIIPYENIADSDTKRSLRDTIFGLYNIHISCQGSVSEIKFRALQHGPAIQNAIEVLVNKADAKLKAKTGDEGPKKAEKREYHREMPAAVPSESVLLREFGMYGPRVYVPMLLLLPIFPLWLFLVIRAFIRVSSTHFSLRRNTVRSSFRFLSTSEREFSYEKVTGVAIRRNLWDRIFGTLTLKFWSIGSGETLEFSHVLAKEVNITKLLNQMGIPESAAPPHVVTISPGLMSWLRAHLGAALVITFVMSAALIPVAYYDYELLRPFVVMGSAVIISLIVIHFIWSVILHKQQSLSFHEHFVTAGQGLITKYQYYIAYRNIKRRISTRYPGGKSGSLEIFAAGEELNGRRSGQDEDSGTVVGFLRQHSFTIRHIRDAYEAGMLLDGILTGRVEPTPEATAPEPLETIVESHRSVKNALVRLLLISVVAFPLILVLPLSMPITILCVKRWRYYVSPARIWIASGVLYRREESILLDRVDSIQQRQGMLNKLFNNGKVSIMTAGSSRPDLKIVDAPAYLKFYEIIRANSH